MYVEHPLIKEKSIEKREYQESILRTAESKNTLVVLPTGIGKTIIAVLLAAKRLEKFRDSKVLVLAPTKPLVEQHRNVFKKCLKIPEYRMQVVTGAISPEKRARKYEYSVIIFATPQTIKNDIEERRINLENFSLLVVDEAHRAVGKYAYTFVASEYMKRAKNPLILALTASPGSKEERIEEICKNLFIEAVEVRSELDEDVKPYIKPVKIEVVKVSLPKELEEIRELIKKSLEMRRDILKENGIVFKTKKELIEWQNELSKRVENEKSEKLISLLKVVADTLKIWHALELLETQSLTALKEYLIRLRMSKQGERVFLSKEMKEVYNRVVLLEEKHPKLEKLKEVVKRELGNGKDVRILVFSHFRDNIFKIYEELKKVEGCKPFYLIGQSGERGLTQKEQVEVIKLLRRVSTTF